VNSISSKLEKLIHLLELSLVVQLKGIQSMSNNFEALSAALAGVEDGIRSVAEAIANPAVDNNDQATIDGLTARLNAAADALAAATAAEDAEDAGPVVEPAPEPQPPVDEPPVG
jgi:hypothetical protein